MMIRRGMLKYRGERGKVVMVRGKLQRTTRRTKGTEKMRVRPKRPNGRPEYFGFINGRNIDFTKRTGGFNEPHPSDAKKD
jgi:hypothetical protein